MVSSGFSSAGVLFGISGIMDFAFSSGSAGSSVCGFSAGSAGSAASSGFLGIIDCALAAAGATLGDCGLAGADEGALAGVAAGAAELSPDGLLPIFAFIAMADILGSAAGAAGALT